MSSSPLTVRPLDGRDRAGHARVLVERWGSTRVVSRGRCHDVGALDGLVAERGGEAVGFLTLRVNAHDLEIVTLDALRHREGVGTRLVEAALTEARARGCARVWLVTTNDNLPAQAFYEALGFECVAVHAGAVEEARRLKPRIPATGVGGVPIRDELEYERAVVPESSRRRSTL